METHPNEPFPVPGLNPDVKVQGTAAKDLPSNHHLLDSSGALWKRERTGFALIQFTLNQPGFTSIDARVAIERLRIAPRFLIRIFVPRDYPAHGVGYAFTFSDDENFELPHYPNIMRRSDSAHHGYWQNVGLFGNVGMEKHFPKAQCASTPSMRKGQGIRYRHTSEELPHVPSTSGKGLMVRSKTTGVLITNCMSITRQMQEP